MQWALLAVILIGLFLISGRFPKLAFSIFGLLIASVIAILVFTSDPVSKAANPLAPADIALSNITVVPAYGGSYTVSGRISNNHQQAELRESNILVQMLDCPASAADSDCQTVGQKSQRVNTRVPAQQARDFQINLYFGEPAISGSLRWQYEVTGAKI